MINLEADFEFFLSKFDDLCKNHRDEFVVVKNKTFVGYYDTFEAAYDDAIKKFDLGTFLIQECKKNANEQSYFSYELIGA